MSTPNPLHALQTYRDADLTGRATAEQRAVMLSWPGWGALAPAFEVTPAEKWVTVADELDQLLTETEIKSARQHLDTSFFTPEYVVQHVFDLLRSAGFTGGRVLEPGCGSGRFMSSTPADMTIDWTGVEVDPVAAGMARLVTPDANIINQPMQKTSLVEGSFDAVVGNVPFSGGTVFDPAFPSSSLHEYFLRRSVHAVRPGGYVIAVTSRHTMDSHYSVANLTEVADLIGAVRLPAGAFKSEGTDVVTDIIIFRKPDAGDAPVGNKYVGRTPVTEKLNPKVWGAVEYVSEYWGIHPNHVAGKTYLTGYSRSPITVVSSNIADDVQNAVNAVKTHLIPQGERQQDTFGQTAGTVPLEDAEGRKEGSFHIIDDALVEVKNGALTPLRESKELRALVALRDAAVELIALESNQDLPDEQISGARAKALQLYSTYVTRFGFLNRGTATEGEPDPETGEIPRSWRRPSMGGFRRDPDYISVMALEHFDQDDGTASPAPILLRRVNRHPEPVTTVETAAEALAVSVGEGRNVDLNRIAGLLSLETTDAALKALGDLVFHDGTGWVPARTYLAGNVRATLAAATRLAEKDSAFERNVAALRAVQPRELGPLEIRVSLGSPWLAYKDVEAFAKEVLGSNLTVRGVPELGVWEIVNSQYCTASADANLRFGTSRKDPIALLDAALNGKSPVVYDDVWEWRATKKVRNATETLAAEEKLRAMDDRFQTWLWEDDERTARVCRDYNERFNAYVVRRPDGDHLTFPGLSADVTPWKHQKDAVDKVITSERTLIGHPVGSGKTIEMILSAVTLRRFGLAQKPLIVVPNHLLEQVAREAQQAYPTGRFLIASKEDLTKDRRRLFAARCATGEWDAVVMTHGAFTSLPVAPEAEARWIAGQKNDLESLLRSTSENAYDNSKSSKAIARSLRALEARTDKLRYGMGDSDQVLFEHLGVDYLMVDEGHLFRRLSTGSSSRDNGFGSGSSKRATDMLLKIDTLAERFPKKPIVAFFTGTPWSNTLAETWVWQRYLQPDVLTATGTMSFDAWVAAFVKYETQVEVAPDGSGFRVKRRPTGVKNWQQLRSMLWTVADIVSADKLGLDRPAFTVETLVADPTPKQKKFVSWLAFRADAVRGDHRAAADDAEDQFAEFKEPAEDGMLLICTDGRKVALDPQLAGIDEESSKLAMAAATVAGIYQQTKDYVYGESHKPGAVQLALLDLGTPHPDDAQSYGRFRSLLAAAGVPSSRVRYIHEAKTDKARAALFAACREGDVSILIGSTSKVGIGTNIQTRLVALHHIDAPWTAAEVEQREGRILRPKNLNKQVQIFRYVTENSFDAYTWQALERKAKSFQLLYDDNESVLELEDVSETVLSYGEVKALAAGNPLLLEQAEAASDVQRLRLMRSVHLQGANRARKNAENASREADISDRMASKLVRVLTSTNGQGTPDPSAMSTVVTHLRGGYAWGKANWRGLQVRGDAETATVQILADYLPVGDLRLKGNVLRRTDVNLAAAIADMVNDWVDELPAMISHHQERAANLRTAAADHLGSADAVVFDGQPDLDAAIARLARIELAIAGEASRTDLVAA